MAAGSSQIRSALSRVAGGLQRRTARMSWHQRLRMTSSLLSRARCKNHLRSRKVSGEIPAVKARVGVPLWGRRAVDVQPEADRVASRGRDVAQRAVENGLELRRRVRVLRCPSKRAGT